MLLVADLANTKWCKNPGILLKPWQMGTHLRVLSQRELSNEYQQDMVTMAFKELCVLVLWRKLALKGLIVCEMIYLSITVYRQVNKNN